MTFVFHIECEVTASQSTNINNTKYYFMAKKNVDKTPLLIVYCAILAAFVILLLMLINATIFFGPIVFLCYIVITSLIGMRQYNKVDLQFVKRKFNPLADELNLILAYQKRIITAYDKIKECKRIVSEEHLHINKDGRISSRSYRGTEVQNALDLANKTIDDLLPKVDYLKSLPMQRYKKALKDYSRFMGGLYSCLLAIVVCFIYVSTYYNQDDIILERIEIFTIPDSFKDILFVVWIYCVILIPSYILSFLTARIYFSINNKKPNF